MQLTADANAAALKARGEAVTAYPKMIDLTLAEKWGGSPAQTILDGQSTVPFFPPAASGK